MTSYFLFQLLCCLRTKKNRKIFFSLNDFVFYLFIIFLLWKKGHKNMYVINFFATVSYNSCHKNIQFSTLYMINTALNFYLRSSMRFLMFVSFNKIILLFIFWVLFSVFKSVSLYFISRENHNQYIYTPCQCIPFFQRFSRFFYYVL